MSVDNTGANATLLGKICVSPLPESIGAPDGPHAKNNLKVEFQHKPTERPGRNGPVD